MAPSGPRRTAVSYDSRLDSSARFVALFFSFFFFNDPATTEIYPLSLHDALPISGAHFPRGRPLRAVPRGFPLCHRDRKSTRLNSSHLGISYAVFCFDRKSTRLNSSHLGISYAVFCFKHIISTQH